MERTQAATLIVAGEDQPRNYQPALFDYAALDSETRIVVQQRTDEIRVLMRRTAQDIIDIGRKLIDVKSRLGHGNFQGWLRAEFDWSYDLAIRFMRVAERFESVNFTDLTLAPSALYLLAAPSTPEPARIEALERASSGEAISHRTAHEIVDRHRLTNDDDDDDWDRPVDPREIIIDNDRVWEAGMAVQMEEYAEELAEYQAAGGELSEDEREVVQQFQPEPTNKMAVHFSSESPEWYTPEHIIERVIDALGAIDLDPCSNSKTEPNVPAKHHLTASDNGLAFPWYGRVYMNPPYGTEIKHWIEKLSSEYEAGNVSEAVALVPARTDTAWFRRLPSEYICFVSGRLTFSEHESAAPFPNAVVYLGNRPDAFRQAFRAIGRVYQLVSESEVAA